MRQILLFTLIFLQITQVNLAQNKTKSVKGLGNIELVTPENEHEFTLRENKTFSWSAPDNLQAGQNYIYIMKLVKMNKDDDSLQAISNPSYVNLISGDLSSNSNYTVNLDTVHFATTQFFAWQVKAFSSDTLFAESDIFTFEGPPLVEQFRAGNRRIYTTKFTKVTPEWDSLCGSGYTFIRKKKVDISFSNIRIERRGAGIYLREGNILGNYKDTVSFYNENGAGLTPLYIDSLIINKDRATVLSNFKPAQVFNGHNFAMKSRAWLKISESYDSPYGRLFLTDTTIKVGDIQLNIDKKSHIYINYKYRFSYSGSLISKLQEDSIKLKIPEGTKNLHYFKSSFELDTIKFNDQINLVTSSSIFDLNDEVSPGIFQDSVQWQGIYFNTLGFDEIKQDSTFTIKLSNLLHETVERGTSSWLAYFSNNKLTLDIDSVFRYTSYSEYNYFNANFNKIEINNLNDTLLWNVTGIIEIPYLDKYFIDFTIPCKKSVIQLAKTNHDSDFNPFPLYEFELKNFAFILEETNDTIKAEIDYNKRSVNIALPYLESEAHSHKVYSNFNVSAHNITINNMGICGGSPDSYLSINKNVVYDLDIFSFDNRIKTYSFNINIEDALNTKNGISKNTIDIYPNPVEEYLYISGLQGNYTINLLDTQGNLKLTGRGNKEQEKLNLSALPKGIYLVKIESNKIIYNKKIIKI